MISTPDKNDVLGNIISKIISHEKFGHTLDKIEIKETHISYILLTGEYVYKFKKAVDFGFLNFTTLEKRKFYCEEEIRLNRRLAPDLYLDVIPVTGSYDSPEINGSGPIIEYAVKMRQFQQDTELNNLLSSGLFKTSYVDQLSEKIAAFHTGIQSVSRNSKYGNYGVISKIMFENIKDLAGYISQDKTCTKKIENINKWTQEQLSTLEKTIIKRKKQGRIKECHGDLHLGNIALYRDEIVIFDCIEFSEELRRIDTICDIAFLIMDFESHDYQSLAYRFLNIYLQETGDYEGLELLRFYCVYRALVRAKIYALSLSNASDYELPRLTHQYQHYIELALKYTKPDKTFIFMTHGFSGSGKTTLSEGILEKFAMIRIRSDIERKRLNRINLLDSSNSGLMKDIYTKEKSTQVYQRLADLTEVIIKAGYPVIVDATFLDKRYRTLIKSLASRLEVPFIILSFAASKQNLIKRIKDRKKQSIDASEADITVLESQIKNEMLLDNTEKEQQISINTDKKINYQNIISQINLKLM